MTISCSAEHIYFHHYTIFSPEKARGQTTLRRLKQAEFRIIGELRGFAAGLSLRVVYHGIVS